jgi:hypothetical protein
MSYTFIKDFRTGMDRRRPISALETGALYTVENAHFTRGGDIEKRKAFVSKYTLPAGTFGAWGINSMLYVFGSAADPGVPVGVNYQRLQSPDGQAMTAFLDATNFDGKIYAIAEFGAGVVYHFYDGVLVQDWYAGVVRASMTDTDGIAAHLETLLDASGVVTASRAGSVLTITKSTNGGFDIEASTQNVTGGTDDQTLTLARTTVGVDEVLGTCQFTVIDGTVSAGVNKIVEVKLQSITLCTNIDYGLSAEVTAQSVADAINAGVSTPDYTASVQGATVVISALPGTGSTTNGFVLYVEVAGDVIITEGGFTVTGGTASAGVNQVTSVKVAGVVITSGAIDWTTSNEDTAEAIAADIRAVGGAYNAKAAGSRVLIGVKQVTSTFPNDRLVEVLTAGDVTVGTLIFVDTTVSAVSGGVTGVAEVWTATVGGTFEVGDKFNISIDDVNYGYVGNPTTKARTALTHKSKVYATAGSLLQFSGVNTATGWNSENDIGAGFVNMANNDSGSQDVVGMEVYQGNLAIFSRRSAIIEFVDPDPTQNRQLQTLKRTGLRAPRGVIAVSDQDVLYFSDSGIRSLRARDSSNAAAVEDVGTAIDPLVRSTANALAQAVVEAAVAAVEPRDGRYWLILGGTIFVFSYYRASQVTAWSFYTPGFTISDTAEIDDRLYCRSGDTIYLYGGDSGEVYDSSTVTVQFGFQHLDKPATAKNLKGFDFDAEGTWAVKVLVNPEDLAEHVDMGTLVGLTYTPSYANTAGEATVTHFAPQLVCSQAGYARISNVAVHHTGANTET